MYESTWQVLDEAAAHGYQDVVRFTTEFATKWGYIESYTARSESDALACAVAGGFDDVAIYLLGNYRIEWNMKNALDRAIEGGRPDIIEWVYVIYSQRTGVGQILAGLAKDGNIGAVKYLYTHFDIPPHAINHAFRNATGISTIHFLYKTGCVSPGSITTVFRDASRRGIFDQEEYYSFEEQLEVVKLLCNDSCIPPRAIRSAFMGAAARGHEDLLELLWTDLRLNDQTFIKAFNVAVNNDNAAITKALFKGGRISAQATNNALLVSSKRGYLAFVQLLIDAPAIFRSTKKKVFLDAVRNNRQWLVQRVCDKGSWPARVLKRAVRIAADRKLKELLQ